MSLAGITEFLRQFEEGHTGMAPRPFIMPDGTHHLPRWLISVPVRRVRVWRTADTLAGGIAIWVRWSVWLLTWGKAGALPWTWEGRSTPPIGVFTPNEMRAALDLPPLPVAPMGGTGAVPGRDVR